MQVIGYESLKANINSVIFYRCCFPTNSLISQGFLLAEVVDFRTNLKRIYVIWTTILDPIAAFQRELLYSKSHFFDTPPLFRPKFEGVLLGADP